MRISFLLQECISLAAYLFSERFKFNSEIYRPIGDASSISVRRGTSLVSNIVEFERGGWIPLMFMHVNNSGRLVPAFKLGSVFRYASLHYLFCLHDPSFVVLGVELFFSCSTQLALL